MAKPLQILDKIPEKKVKSKKEKRKKKKKVEKALIDPPDVDIKAALASEDDDSDEDMFDEETGQFQKKGKFARIVKVITHIRPLLKRDVIEPDG